MKTIIKIEIVILVLALLVGGVLCALSAGVLNWFREPVAIEQSRVPIATDAPMVPLATEEPVEPMSQEQPQQAPVEEPTVPPQTDPETGEVIPTEPRVITATKYFVYDIREGEYLKKQGNSEEKLYPASITKLLTAHVILAHMKPEDTVVVGDALTLVQEGSSVAGLLEGDSLSVEQLIAAMMLPSGNDAAQVAAVAVGRKLAKDEALPAADAIGVFMKEMNSQAKALGMENSHFENPDGFHHENHYTTMDDLVTLSAKVLADPVILKYTSRAADTVILPERTLEWKNTNLLLHSDSEAYLPNTIGLKTGYTSEAGGCLVTAFFEKDRLLLVGVFGCPAYTMDRYLDTVDIYNSI